ncbi:MAG: D-alanine--D-alanine ligase [Candidatus Saelkia tenebricola]|nr:D-alanine--D-alanine ligase [Candidatus Saelkia tenebricola]
MVKTFKNHKIALLRGGPSSERKISLFSGREVFKSLKRWQLNVCDLIVPIAKDLNYLKNWILTRLDQEKVDICFIALHGWFGEDGQLQNILEKEGYLYTGSNSCASEYAMSKMISKSLFEDSGIPTPKYKVLENNSGFDLNDFNYPLVIKPSAQGSSIGVFKVDKKKDLKSVLKEVFSYDGRVIIEEFLKANELTVGILANQPLPVIKINYPLDIYNYQSKYTKGVSKYVVPADIDKNIAKRSKALALKAHNALGCHSFSRVDMLYSYAKDEVYVLEVNTIPGLTRGSLLPRAAGAAGIEFDELVLKMLKSALK